MLNTEFYFLHTFLKYILIRTMIHSYLYHSARNHVTYCKDTMSSVTLLINSQQNIPLFYFKYFLAYHFNFPDFKLENNWEKYFKGFTLAKRFQDTN